MLHGVRSKLRVRRTGIPQEYIRIPDAYRGRDISRNGNGCVRLLRRPDFVPSVLRKVHFRRYRLFAPLGRILGGSLIEGHADDNIMLIVI